MARLRRAKHNLTHWRLLTGDMGYLYPCACIEVLPGDSFRHMTAVMLRMSPLVKPVMHPVRIKVHHWYIPNRLVYDEWEDLITESGGSAIPQHTITATPADEALLDYLGVDPEANGKLVSKLPIRGYNKIYNEMYRDQDLITEVSEDFTDIQKVSWDKDTFTTARLAAQKGAAIEVGFSAGVVPVRGIGNTPSTAYDKVSGTVQESAGFASTAADVDGERWDTNDGVWLKQHATETDHPDVYVDLSNASGGIDINELRNAFATQRIAEARNRYGSRYADYLRFMGVNPSDGRLQRPEYLGGGKAMVAFSEVLSTGDAGTAVVGDMAGHGIAALRSRPYRRFFEEHGYVISLISVRPVGMYSQGMDKHWLKTDSVDFWDKIRETEGAQTVDALEIYTQGTQGTFGYADRHYEYRRQLSLASGKFRTTENDWHLGREFSSTPALNQSFLECTPRTDIFADANIPQMYIQAHHRIAARRLVRKRARI